MAVKGGLAKNGGRRRFAFVLPRFGEALGGGAETLAGALAAKLAARGDEVEVLTTCALDNRTWENYFPPGETRQNGVRISRYPVDARNLDSWAPLQVRIAEGLRLSVEEQFQWLDNGVNSSELYQCLVRRAGEFEALFFAPYLFSTTFYGALLCREKAVLIPCLHDEYYAYVAAIQSMFRQVRGCVFNSPPEKDLARQLFGELRGGYVGMGFEALSEREAQELNPYFRDSGPYILYIGRKETGKGVQVLIDYFVDLKDAGYGDDLKLVIAGAGSFADLKRPAAGKREDIVDLPQVTEQDKRRLIKHAVFLCQPSINESFSIVLMEAWTLGTPVVVNAKCPVTRYHVIESGGGLYFGDAMDFAAVVERLRKDGALRASLAGAGAEYVRRFYNWDAVLKRFDNVMADLEMY